jgi:hypothetical protein
MMTRRIFSTTTENTQKQSTIFGFQKISNNHSFTFTMIDEKNLISLLLRDGKLGKSIPGPCSYGQIVYSYEHDGGHLMAFGKYGRVHRYAPYDWRGPDYDARS